MCFVCVPHSVASVCAASCAMWGVQRYRCETSLPVPHASNACPAVRGRGPAHLVEKRKCHQRRSWRVKELNSSAFRAPYDDCVCSLRCRLCRRRQEPSRRWQTKEAAAEEGGEKATRQQERRRHASHWRLRRLRRQRQRRLQMRKQMQRRRRRRRRRAQAAAATAAPALYIRRPPLPHCHPHTSSLGSRDDELGRAQLSAGGRPSTRTRIPAAHSP